MNKIVSKEQFSANVTKLVVEAPLIAKSRRAGHFVIVRCGEKGERIPLTIADSDPKAGTITLVLLLTATPRPAPSRWLSRAWVTAPARSVPWNPVNVCMTL